jgi:putative SOS response-associated peptidase YedK
MARSRNRGNPEILHHAHHPTQQLRCEVHDRMPALLAEKGFEPWLSGEAGIELLKPAADDLMQRWPVSKRVNSSKAPAEDATLIERIGVKAA